jgi:hypothetical protein
MRRTLVMPWHDEMKSFVSLSSERIYSSQPSSYETIAIVSQFSVTLGITKHTNPLALTEYTAVVAAVYWVPVARTSSLVALSLPPTRIALGLTLRPTFRVKSASRKNSICPRE